MSDNMAVYFSLHGTLVAADSFSQWPSNLQEELCQRVALFVCGKSAELDINAVIENADLLDYKCPTTEMESIANGIQCIYRGAVQLDLDGDKLGQQLQKSFAWSEASVAVIKNVWTRTFSSGSSSLPSVSIGQLVSFDWSLGMSMSSSECRNLNSPFVSVRLRIAEPSGQIVSKSFELTGTEFQNFSRQIQNMAKALDSA